MTLGNEGCALGGMKVMTNETDTQRVFRVSKKARAVLALLTRGPSLKVLDAVGIGSLVLTSIAKETDYGLTYVSTVLGNLMSVNLVYRIPHEHGRLYSASYRLNPLALDLRTVGTTLAQRLRIEEINLYDALSSSKYTIPVILLVNVGKAKSTRDFMAIFGFPNTDYVHHALGRATEAGIVEFRRIAPDLAEVIATRVRKPARVELFVMHPEVVDIIYLAHKIGLSNIGGYK